MRTTGDGGGEHTTLHAHGDGTYHTEGHDGERTEHPHIGHALAHMAAKHEPDGKHSHVHHEDGGGHVSHHSGGGEGVSGPHDHENLEALKNHMGKFLNEEENEWSGSDYSKGRSEGKGGGHESLYG